MKSIIIGIVVLGLVFMNLTNEDQNQNDNELSCKQKADILFDLTECENKMKEIALNGDENAVANWAINTQEGVACDRLYKDWQTWINECEGEL